MKRAFKFMFAMVIAIVGIFAVSVKAAPSSLKMSRRDYFNPIGSMSISRKEASSGSTAYTVYCIDLQKKNAPAVGSAIDNKGELKPGYAYIMQNGYPHDSHSNMSANDRYAATQIAMWWYVDYLNGIENTITPRPEYKNSNGVSYDPLQNFKNGKYKDTNIYKMAVQLRDGAKKAGAYESPSIKINGTTSAMSLSSDRKYYQSNAIAVTAKNVSGNYTVGVSGAPSGTIVTDTKGNKKTSFSVGDKFVIKVPTAKFSNLSNNFTVNINAEGSTKKAYKYASSSSLQGLSALFPETKKVQDSVKLTFVATRLKITKTDMVTGEKLPGAKLEVKDSKGNVIASWITTDEDYYIDNLLPGKYTLTETAAPEGYQLNANTVEFEVKASGEIISVEMQNAPEESPEPAPEPVVTETVIVPDTASTASIIMYALGTAVIIVGSGLVIRNVRKQKASK